MGFKDKRRKIYNQVEDQQLDSQKTTTVIFLQCVQVLQVNYHPVSTCLGTHLQKNFQNIQYKLEFERNLQIASPKEAEMDSDIEHWIAFKRQDL